MDRERALRLALDVLTEGADARLPAPWRRPARQAACVEACRTARPWTEGPGVQALGVARKETAGVRRPTLALAVYVERKKPRHRLAHPVPPVVRVPGLPPLPTDVVEIGRVRLERFAARVRPAMPGCGVGHPRVTVGTFGALVRRRKGAGRFLLSNAHVIADEGVAARGDPVLQPGAMDGGRAPGDVLGTLQAHVPFSFTEEGFPNLVDAAIARVRARDVTPLVRILGVAPKGVARAVRRGMRVQKVGRTTDHTTGVVRDVDLRLALSYQKPGGGRGRVGLRDQVLCSRFTEGGDSGSLVLTLKHEAVGLHFAGSVSSSIFNRIGHVLRLLDVVLA